ncbi:MAG: hypothetical protein ACRD09_09565 [Vicinamibacterales bacterium]
MPRPVVALAVLATMAAIGLAAGADAQTPRRRPPPKPVPPPPTVAPADVSCPNVLGRGVRTKLLYCDVVAGRNPADGIRIKVPPHMGAARLTFTLHNRHLYSEEQIRAGKGYVRYLATIGALAPDGRLITRAIVLSEFRNAKDLVDRIEGGAGEPLKAVAPTGAEPIAVEVPSEIDEVSLLGEKLEATRADGRETYTSPGRLIATVSDVKIEYRPKPGKKK